MNKRRVSYTVWHNQGRVVTLAHGTMFSDFDEARTIRKARKLSRRYGNAKIYRTVREMGKVKISVIKR